MQKKWINHRSTGQSTTKQVYSVREKSNGCSGEKERRFLTNEKRKTEKYESDEHGDKNIGNAV